MFIVAATRSRKALRVPPGFICPVNTTTARRPGGGAVRGTRVAGAAVGAGVVGADVVAASLVCGAAAVVCGTDVAAATVV
jgi:hypothetical protein